MKTKHIVFCIKNEKVLLFLNHRMFFSGYVLENKPNEESVSLIGEVCIKDDEKGEEEFFYFYTTDTELSSYYGLQGPTWFLENRPPLKEMSILQKTALPFVLERKRFSGTGTLEKGKIKEVKISPK